jgi:hypothetical protein
LLINGEHVDTQRIVAPGPSSIFQKLTDE